MSQEFRDEMLKSSALHPSSREEQAVSLVERELETIFGNSGKQVLLKEFSSRYEVTLRDAIRRPSAFQIALFQLVGELGSALVMGRVNSRILAVASSPLPKVSGMLG